MPADFVMCLDDVLKMQLSSPVVSSGEMMECVSLSRTELWSDSADWSFDESVSQDRERCNEV